VEFRARMNDVDAEDLGPDIYPPDLLATAAF
jgi:hypothetical protein